MGKRIKVGILKETKNPPDRRVASTPRQGIELLKRFPFVELTVQPSKLRCYKDDEYRLLGLQVNEDVSGCDILIGIKEVAIETLIPEKTYIFFSHTAKKQPYNRKLLQEIINKKITLIDYEYLTDSNNARLVAFGHWAGVVGAYNALVAWGKKYKLYDIQRAYLCHDMSALVEELKKVKLPNIKILISGSGRVAHGALQTLSNLKLRKVSPADFLNKEYSEPVICQLEPKDYVANMNGKEFELCDFFSNPADYISTFKPFTKVADIYIPCHFWNPQSPLFITESDIKEPDFKISVVADISCDIKQPVASTLRSSTIADPFYGYNKLTGQEDDPWNKENITVMAVDNLPGELPRDASEFFGECLLKNILHHLFNDDSEKVIERATIARNGELTERYKYLENFLKGLE